MARETRRNLYLRDEEVEELYSIVDYYSANKPNQTRDEMDMIEVLLEKLSQIEGALK